MMFGKAKRQPSWLVTQKPVLRDKANGPDGQSPPLGVRMPSLGGKRPGPRERGRSQSPKVSEILSGSGTSVRDDESMQSRARAASDHSPNRNLSLEPPLDMELNGNGSPVPPSVVESRHASRKGLPGSPASYRGGYTQETPEVEDTPIVKAKVPTIAGTLQQLVHLIEDGNIKTFDANELELLAKVNALMSYPITPPAAQSESPPAPEEAPRPVKHLARSPILKARSRLESSTGGTPEVLWGVVVDIFANVDTQDQLGMMLNAYIPSLLTVDECAFFRLEEDHMFDVQASAKVEICGLVGYVATTNTAIRMQYPQSHELFDPEVDTEEADVYMCVPIASRGAVSGVLRVSRYDTNRGPFADKEQKVLESLSVVVGECMRSLKLGEIMDFEMKKNNFMLELAWSLASVEVDCDKLCAMVLDYARALCNADRCSLFLVDALHQELEAHFEGGTVVKMSMTRGIAGHVATTGEVVNIADAYNDDRFNRTVDIQTGYHTESILCLPILFENSVVAVAQLVNKLTPDGQTVSQFTAKDVETFQGFSGYAAVSLRNARLFRMADLEHAKSESMLSLAHALASDALDEARVTKTVMEYARTLTQADRCSLYLVVDNGPERTLQVYLEDGHVMRTPIDAGIPGHVLATGEPVNVADAYLDSRFNKSIDCLTGYRTRSLLCMPVEHDGEVVAVAQVVNKLDKDKQIVRFTSDDMETFSTFATYAGASLRTARLVTAQRAVAARHSMLLTQVRLLEEAICDWTSLVSQVVAGASALVPSQRCLVHVVDLRTRELETHTAGAPAARVPFGDGIECRVIETQQVQRVSRRSSDSGPSTNGKATHASPRLSEAVICVPVVHQEATVAVLQLVNKLDDSNHPQDFEVDDGTVLEMYAQHVAITMQVTDVHRAQECPARVQGRA